MLPSFETERLLLRPRSMNDFESCLAMDRDPRVTQFIPGPWNDPERHERFLRERIQQTHGAGLGYWSIFPKDAPDRFAGWILLIPRGGIGPEIEIGWRLNRSSWGRGYATEAARPIAEHAFETVGLTRIVADIHARNTASSRVAEKIGMTVVGEGVLKGVPCTFYAITAEDPTSGLPPPGDDDTTT
jgi:RimJ/RimL family protein N-acetyltransferase